MIHCFYYKDIKGGKMKNIFIGLSLCCSFLACDFAECVKKPLGKAVDAKLFDSNLAKALREESKGMRVVASQTQYVLYNLALHEGRVEAWNFFGKIVSLSKAIPSSNNLGLGRAVLEALFDVFPGHFSKAGFRALFGAIEAVKDVDGSGFVGKLEDFINDEEAWKNKLVDNENLTTITDFKEYLIKFPAKIKAGVGGDVGQVKNYAYASIRKIAEMGKEIGDEELKEAEEGLVAFVTAVADMIKNPETYCPPAAE
jgi:hypothetical protein